MPRKNIDEQLNDKETHESYGLHGQGQPILIEKYNGELRVVIWSDINQEDHTHIISLEGSKEDKRVGKEYEDSKSICKS